jgi:hypothetical protein
MNPGRALALTPKRPSWGTDWRGGILYARVDGHRAEAKERALWNESKFWLSS